ncbi:MAG: crossover junction endodeoxyribonuclease RuvC [Candidatus Falkowbacteria bacterium]
MIILGIDPGFARTGWGVVEYDRGKLRPVDYGCIETMKGEDFSDRLSFLYDEIVKKIKKFKPDVVAVEELFFYNNVTTAIKVSHGRGVILLAAKKARVPIREFTPLQVKQAISGYGKADKIQVQKMVRALLNLREIPKPDDAADALAIAICAASNKLCQSLN